MDNDKRVLLAIVLSIAVWLLYESFMAPPPTARKTQPPAPQQTAQSAPDTAVLPTPPPVRALKFENPPADAAQAAALPDESYTSIGNALFTARFSNSLACIASFKLHNYKDALPPPAIVNWFMNATGRKTASISTGSDNFKEMVHVPPTSALPLKTSFVYQDGKLSEIDAWHIDTDQPEMPADHAGSLHFTGKDQQALQFDKRFSFSKDKYTISFDMVLSNTGLQNLEGNPYVEWTTKKPTSSGGGFLSRGNVKAPRFAYLIKDAVEKKNLKDVKEEIVIQGEDIVWTSIEEKYFISAIVPGEIRPAQIRLSGTGQLVAYKLVYPYIMLRPGETKTYRFSLYLGPRDIDILEQQGVRLERTIDFGWFDIIAKPLLLTLKFFNGFLHNYGLSIILLTLIIKILFWPLTHKSFASMKGMQKLQPEIAALKEKFKDNREEFARQQMELYRRYKVNPLGGCLPMVLQIPVFIALYRALMDSIELRHATFIPFWINDLSAKDPTYIAPLVMGASMFLQQKMTPTSADPTQARMMMFMPIMFTVMFLNFPSGLVVYWLVNNLISIAQQVYINKQHHEAGGSECSPSKSKPKPSKKLSR